MTKVVKILFLLFYYLVTVMLVACAATPTAPQPPEIIEGYTLCDSCGMIISDARYAAATIALNGEGRKFDDIGEMLKYHMMDHPEAQVKIWFVRDYYTKEWLRGEQAFFVWSPKIKTPMGGNALAFKDQAAAKKYATEINGQFFNLDDLRLELHKTH